MEVSGTKVWGYVCVLLLQINVNIFIMQSSLSLIIFALILWVRTACWKYLLVLLCSVLDYYVHIHIIKLWKSNVCVWVIKKIQYFLKISSVWLCVHNCFFFLIIITQSCNGKSLIFINQLEMELLLYKSIVIKLWESFLNTIT